MTLSVTTVTQSVPKCHSERFSSKAILHCLLSVHLIIMLTTLVSGVVWWGRSRCVGRLLEAGPQSTHVWSRSSTPPACIHRLRLVSFVMLSLAIASGQLCHVISGHCVWSVVSCYLWSLRLVSCVMLSLVIASGQLCHIISGHCVELCISCMLHVVSYVDQAHLKKIVYFVLKKLT